jgi:hypothetical protein
MWYTDEGEDLLRNTAAATPELGSPGAFKKEIRGSTPQSLLVRGREA